MQSYSPDVFFHLAWDGTTGEQRGDYTVQLKNVRDTCDAYNCAVDVGCQKFVAAWVEECRNHSGKAKE